MSESIDSYLRSTADEARRRLAADRRYARGINKQIDSEEANLVGTLCDIGERRRTCSIQMVSGSNYRGTVVTLGSDGFVIESRRSKTVLHLDALVSIRHAGSAYDRRSESRTNPSFVSMIDDLIHSSGTRASVVTRSGTVLRGRIRSTGGDHIQLALDGSRDTMTLATSAIEAVIAR